MRKIVLLLIISILALTGGIVNAAPPDEPPGLARAIAAQEAHNPALLATAGVVGTAVGLAGDGTAVVKVLTERAGIRGIPGALDGVPVMVEVTGEIKALAPSAMATSRSLRTTDRWARPVPTGISTGNANEWSAGTIGARVKDALGNVYALSNNHVYAREGAAAIGEEVLQPGLYDTGGVYDAANHLGNLSNFVGLVFDGTTPNYVDAAVAATDTTLLSNATPTSIGGYGAPNSITLQATIGMQVKKFGRTTKLTKGQITGINASVKVTYSSGTALFENQIIVGSNKPFIKGGDSGSLLVTNNSNANPVGLLFAGSSSGTMAVANGIDAVLGALGVTIDGK